MDRLDAMQAFVAVADLKGFAPAARKLGLSPSAVTRLIAALEERLGARLLQRTTRSLALTDAGTRYLERIRRILADVEEAEGAAEGERTRPSGRLVVSAPDGFGRLHVSPVMSAYLARYPEVTGELRLSDRMINLVEDGVDLAVRIGHLGDSTLVARHVGEMRRIVVASSAYLKQYGEPKMPEAVASHVTIQFGTATAAPEWRFIEGGREVRVTVTPRFTTNSADAAINYAAQGGGLTRVLAYQAAEAIKDGRLKTVLTKFEPPALPIHIVYPTSRLLSAKVRAFIDLVVETADWHFGQKKHRHSVFGTTRNVPLARAITTSSALIRLCAKQIVRPVRITSLSTASHCPTFAVPTKSTASPIVTSEETPPICCAQL